MYKGNLIYVVTIVPDTKQALNTTGVPVVISDSPNHDI